MVTTERQRLLQEQYYFLCECEACRVQEGQQQQDSTRGRRDESGLLCLKCKEALEVFDQPHLIDLFCSFLFSSPLTYLFKSFMTFFSEGL